MFASVAGVFKYGVNYIIFKNVNLILIALNHTCCLLITPRLQKHYARNFYAYFTIHVSTWTLEC